MSYFEPETDIERTAREQYDYWNTMVVELRKSRKARQAEAEAQINILKGEETERGVKSRLDAKEAVALFLDKLAGEAPERPQNLSGFQKTLDKLDKEGWL